MIVFILRYFILHLLFIFLFLPGLTQVAIELGDPPNPSVPDFFNSKISDIQKVVESVAKGEVKTIATSPGGLPVYAVFYGEKEDFQSMANYNSAVASKNPANYAKKDSSTKPVVFFIGPVHGQEVEGIVGMLNLIHIAETGKDYRGTEWKSLKNKMEKCRIIIIPCGNPDGRKRCPYDGFVGLPTTIMTKYGQGTKKDGTNWGWPGAKSVHPMKGDVKILGAYFNDNGINVMQDEYFHPMANETKAILEIARTEAPDITVSLHSHENRPIILQPAFVPMFMKKRALELALKVNQRYNSEGLPATPEEWFWKPTAEDEEEPPRTTFNLTSALHHISGTMSFTFECSHGSISETENNPLVNYDNILDIQLLLYDEILNYILNKKIPWN